MDKAIEKSNKKGFTHRVRDLVQLENGKQGNIIVVAVNEEIIQQQIVESIRKSGCHKIIKMGYKEIVSIAN